MTSTPAEKLEALRAFANDMRDVTAPELSPLLPTYVLPADGDGSRPLAVTGGLLAFEYRHELETAGLWSGWGFLAVVDLDGVDDYLTGTAVLTHEWTHFLEHLAFTSALIAAAPPETLLQDAPPAPEATAEALGARATMPPWTGHDRRYLRLLAHVVYRLQAAGWPGDVDDCFPSRHYLLSRASRYAEHLGTEPAYLADLPICRILETRCPSDYTAFAAADMKHAIRRWHLRDPLSPPVPAERNVVPCQRF